MAENQIYIQGSKKEQYEGLILQIKSVLDGESDMIANMANISAMLHAQFKHLWTGFYLVKENELVLGPFQGPLACTRIRYGKGVCGTAWKEERIIIVEDVNKFPGHIACSSLSNSEIVVPVFNNGNQVAVLDMDSVEFAAFDETDGQYLGQICSLLFS